MKGRSWFLNPGCKSSVLCRKHESQDDSKVPQDRSPELRLMKEGNVETAEITLFPLPVDDDRVWWSLVPIPAALLLAASTVGGRESKRWKKLRQTAKLSEQYRMRTFPNGQSSLRTINHTRANFGTMLYLFKKKKIPESKASKLIQILYLRSWRVSTFPRVISVT